MSTSKKRILILGGTAFLGPELVEHARAEGHTLTLFNRGKTNPHLFPDIEKLHGDRKSDLSALRGRTWDVVIDTSANTPKVVQASAELLKDAVKSYVFISTISVYGDPVTKDGPDETAPVAKLTTDTDVVTNETYGALKALSEKAAETALPGRAIVIRPGLIVGPTDPTDRFTYWPARFGEGGDILAPGTASDPAQIIDVRDLAAWTIAMAVHGEAGTFNAVGPNPAIGMGDLVSACQRAAGVPSTITWADAPFLEKQKVGAWMDMPVWVGNGDDTGMARVRIAKAVQRGLTFRPLEETARDTLAWWRTLPAERRTKPKAGLSRAREAEVLAAFRAQKRG